MINFRGKKHILIVDDEQEVVQIIFKQMLKNKMDLYTPLVAMDGYEALECMRRNEVDLVILDVKMMNLDGYEVCRIAKADENMKNIPIIITSGYLEEEDRTKFRELGVTEFLDKPYPLDELFRKIDHTFEALANKES